MRNKIKAVLFDLDGVIVFTDKYHYEAWKRLADEEGWTFDKQINEKLRGISRLESLQVILDHNNVELTHEQKLEFVDRKNGYYVDYLSGINQSDLYPGAVEFVKELRAKGTKLAICSSSRNATMVLDRLGLTPLFDAIVTGADIKRTKPDPEIFSLTAERLGIHPVNCLVFEDAEAGIAGARAAHMKSIGVGAQTRSQRRWRRSEAMMK